MAFPTDSKLLNRSRVRLVKLCHKHGVVLRQSYARKGPEALLRANRYGHARQMKRMGGQVKNSRPIWAGWCVTRSARSWAIRG